MSKKILILEDEVLVAADIDEILTKKNYEVAISNSVNEALIIALDFKPDVILCDINLNDKKSGIDFINELHATKKYFEVIYISSYTYNEYIKKSQITNPITYLVKPFSDEQLIVSVEMAFMKVAENEIILNKIKKLTKSELAILQLIANQHSSKEISEKLYVEEKTIRNHRYNISKTLEISEANNSLLMWAIRNKDFFMF